MKFEIKNRWSGAVIFSIETESLRLAVEAAVKGDADLSFADLRFADLSGANLHDANLHDANLHGADLSGANLHDANLHGADLGDANLHGADLGDVDLSDANLHGADLRSADLHDVNLHGADLHGADLHGANLHGADLTPIRDDFWAVLSSSPAEVMGLRSALVEGHIKGSTYTGECACLVGTIAKVKNVSPYNMSQLKPNVSRPIERFFLGINPGDTPENNQPSKLVLEWLDQWVENVKGLFGSLPKEAS